MKKKSRLSVVILSVIACSCTRVDFLGNGDAVLDEVENNGRYVPMSFSAIGQETSSAPQTRSGISNIHNTFKVFSTLVMQGSPSTIMDGYKVSYLEDSGWNYDQEDGQNLQYWDNAAQLYRFHAGAPYSSVLSITEDNLTLNLTTTNRFDETVLLSDPVSISSSSKDFGKSISLPFMFANSRVRVSFVNSGVADVTLSDISLTPVTSYSQKANLVFGYDWENNTHTLVDIDALEVGSSPLAFDDVIIPAQNENPIFTEPSWYVIPGDQLESKWSITLKVNGTQKTCLFTLNNKWEPNKSYTYNFSIKAGDVELFNVGIEEINIYEANTDIISQEVIQDDFLWGQDTQHTEQVQFLNLGLTEIIDGVEYDVLWANSNIVVAAEELSPLFAWDDITSSISECFGETESIRVPTKSMYQKLLDECDWTWQLVKQDSTKEFSISNIDFHKSAWKVSREYSGKTSTLTFPLTGWSEDGVLHSEPSCDYWTSTSDGGISAFVLHSDNSTATPMRPSLISYPCTRNFAIRPVLLKKKE